MKTWVRVNEDGRRIGESHPQAVLSDVAAAAARPIASTPSRPTTWPARRSRKRSIRRWRR